MAERYTRTTGLAITILLGAILVFPRALPGRLPVARASTNLLSNPGFEGLQCAPSSPEGWCDENWTRATHTGAVYDNIFTPQGWVTWWRAGTAYGRPEVNTIPRVDPFIGPPARIRSGSYAAMFFTAYRNHDGGFYQVVHGLEPGATVQASAYAHSWSCDTVNQGLSCGDPWTMTFQVGIEPNGVPDPYSPHIVWNEEQSSPDDYRKIGPTTATVGPTGRVTVILRSKTRWPVKHLDAYWDDASLRITSSGAVPTEPAVPEETAVPGREQSTATPGPSVTPTETSVPVTTTATPDSVTPATGPVQYALTATPEPDPGIPAPPTQEPTGASICVLAFHDHDGDGVRDPATEELLPEATFTIAGVKDTYGEEREYETDGFSEPYCFTQLAPGAYRVIQHPPAAYAASGPRRQTVILTEGMSVDVHFALTRTQVAEGPEETATAPPGDEAHDERSEGPDWGPLVGFGVVGVLALVLAGTVAVLSVPRGRRRY